MVRSRNLAGQVLADDKFIFQQLGQRPVMTAQVQDRGEIPIYVEIFVIEPIGYLTQQKVMVGEGGRGPVPVAAQGVPVKDKCRIVRKQFFCHTCLYGIFAPGGKDPIMTVPQKTDQRQNLILHMAHHMTCWSHRLLDQLLPPRCLSCGTGVQSEVWAGAAEQRPDLCGLLAETEFSTGASLHLLWLSV